HLASNHSNFIRNEFFEPILEENKKVKSDPGLNYKYSNLGYIYLALIIEAVTEMSYEEYVSKNILDRIQLGSDVIDFKIPNGNLHAKGYHSIRSISMILMNFLLDKSEYMEEPVGKWKPFKKYYVNGAPYGGLIANSGGMVKYGQVMLQENNTLLSRKSKDL